MNNIEFDKIVTHLQTTGFVFQGSQIYGGKNLFMNLLQMLELMRLF